ncbi:MAG: aldolase/citrate lyase family protein [Rhodopseudomonas palustris]|nr:aldolase/citrate lyase family protein [Rhodopseudomonas palustris]
MSLVIRRSTLILPVNVPRFVEKAHLRGADAVMLDLEDAVPRAGEGQCPSPGPRGDPPRVARRRRGLRAREPRPGPSRRRPRGLGVA